MIKFRREAFNRAFTEDAFAHFLTDLGARAGVPVDFHLSETPCFFPMSLMDELVRFAQAIIGDLLGNPAYRQAADAVVPARFRVPRSESRPTFMIVDVGLVETERGLEGRLVELQAFPSLYGFQVELAQAHLDAWKLDGVTPFFSGLDRDSYVRTCQHAITGPHDPAEVVLLEIDPRHQKTRPDFAITERLWGVRAIDVHDVEKDGRRLFYRRDGVRTPIARVYNRVIADELEHKHVTLPFEFSDDLDVEFIGGPDWFFRISKFSIPWLKHPWVPETHFLHELKELPRDRDNWLLKPLFSFAGVGIVFAPTDEQIAAIPPAERKHFILQRRINFARVIDTPDGPTQPEIRLMFLKDADGYLPVMPLIRMGRGKMMGVDFNKGLRWVGASAALMDPAL